MNLQPALRSTLPFALALLACGSGGKTPNGSNSGGNSADAGAGDAQSGSDTGVGGSGTDRAGAAATGGAAHAGSTGASGGRPSGWLYTDGAKLKMSDGKGGGTVWVGRGVNLDDLFFCGYNNTLWMPNGGDELKKVVDGLLTGWKPTFVRLSLSMDSYKTVSWVDDVATYQKPMIDVVRALGAHEGVYVLLTLRSDASMVGEDMQHGDPEATGIPSDAESTPDAGKFPTGTDALYATLVDTFKDDPFVLFGLTNEPGGNLLTNDRIRSAMDHAVSTIRAEEDKLGVPHHIVSVQGQGWTSDISFYAKKPLSYDNVVYEVHGYPPPAQSYTYDTIPVIIGEYGPGGADTGFLADFIKDLEGKQLSSTAWDFDSYSNCAPDLVQVNQSSTNLMPTEWGKAVQSYLLDHAR